MNLPEACPLSAGEKINVPYVIVGDEAFALKKYMMRPYPGKNKGLSQEKRIYNYRHSRCRRTVENYFGILVIQWRILKRVIEASVEKCMLIVQAIICLHNFLRKQDIGVDQYINETMLNLREEEPFTTNDTAYHETTRLACYNTSVSAVKIREEYMRYFNAEGAVPWQYDRIVF